MQEMEALIFPLPEDILKCRHAGYLEEEIARIDDRLAGDPPEPLRRRLELERRIALLTPKSYPFDREGALAFVRERIPDLTSREFDGLERKGSIESIFLEGEKRYLASFRDSLLKTDAELRRRAGMPPERPDGKLADAIARLREEGRLAFRISLEARLRLSDEVFRPGAHLRVHLPLPRLCAQQSDISVRDFDGSSLDRPDALQRTAFFDRAMSENEPFRLSYSYTNEVRYLPVYDMDRVGDGTVYPGERPAEPDDLAEQAPHIVFTPYLRALAETVTEGESSPLGKARRIYDHITKNIRYMYMRPYFLIEDQAEYCALSGHGDCGIQAILFITLCRICGIPARWQSGLAVDERSAGCHDWAQFHIEPLGWLFADPSYGGAAYRQGDEARRRFYFGNLDPFRMAANGRYQTGFSPEKRAWRADPYDNQSGEVEMDGEGLWEDQFTTEYRTLEMKALP